MIKKENKLFLFYTTFTSNFKAMKTKDKTLCINNGFRNSDSDIESKTNRKHIVSLANTHFFTSIFFLRHKILQLA